MCSSTSYHKVSCSILNRNSGNRDFSNAPVLFKVWCFHLEQKIYVPWASHTFFLDSVLALPLPLSGWESSHPEKNFNWQKKFLKCSFSLRTVSATIMAPNPKESGMTMSGVVSLIFSSAMGRWCKLSERTWLNVPSTPVGSIYAHDKPHSRMEDDLV